MSNLRKRKTFPVSNGMNPVRDQNLCILEKAGKSQKYMSKYSINQSDTEIYDFLSLTG